MQMMNLFKRSAIGTALIAASMMAGTAAHAGVVTFDVAGISSNAGFGDASNETHFINLFEGARITAISWNVNLSTFSSSWLSEIGVDLSDGSANGFSLFAGIGEDASGSGSFSGSADLIALGTDFYVGSSGKVRLEFFEYLDDVISAADGRWDRGSLTVTYVPEPSSFALAALALLGVGITTRRRKS